METMTKERFNEIIDEIYFNRQMQGTEPANEIWEYIEMLTQPNNTEDDYCECKEGPRGRTVTADFEHQVCDRCGLIAK